MKKVLITILICIVFVILAGIYLLWTAMYPPVWMLEKFAARITALDDKYPDDVEMQMGFLFLYRHYGNDGLNSSKYTARDKYERILELDPNNRAAWALKSYHACLEYPDNSKALIKCLERILDEAGRQNLDKIKFSDCPFELRYWYWYGEGVEAYIARDAEGPNECIAKDEFDIAVEKLRKKFGKKAAEVFEIINEGQRNDPENALYNYLKARVYLAMGEVDNALKEIKEGVSKKYLSTYQEQTSKAAEKVLSKAWFPQPYKFFILDSHFPFTDFLACNVWRIDNKRYYVDGNWYEKKNQGLSDIAISCETQGDFEKAERIYKLTIAMAKQAEVEQRHPSGLHKAAEKRLEELHDKMPMEAEK